MITGNDYIKYPRTPHFPWSNPSKDDKILKDSNCFNNQEVVVSIKKDGEATTMYPDYIHARSLEPLKGQDRSYVKTLHSQICHNIPKGWRICGENLQAVHSIEYKNLPSYFMVISIWNELNECLSWKETKEWCELLDLITVPVIYQSVYDEEIIKNCYCEFYNDEPCEGYVVRLADSFKYKDFSKSVAKMVRKNHVTSSKHWRHQEIKYNIINENYR